MEHLSIFFLLKWYNGIYPLNGLIGQNFGFDKPGIKLESVFGLLTQFEVSVFSLEGFLKKENGVGSSFGR
jgi:hypothetical protein